MPLVVTFDRESRTVLAKHNARVLLFQLTHCVHAVIKFLVFRAHLHDLRDEFVREFPAIMDTWIGFVVKFAAIFCTAFTTSRSKTKSVSACGHNLMIFFICGSKPISNIRSASSRTTYAAELAETGAENPGGPRNR